MLIAVGSWPFIRGTLSPSPPGARWVRGLKSYTPTLYLFVQLRRRRRSHRPSDHHSPLGQTFHSPSSPFPYTRARLSRKETFLSFSPAPTSGSRVSFSSVASARARDVSLRFFPPHISLPVYLDCASLGLRYFLWGMTDIPIGRRFLGVGSCRGINRVRVPFQFGRTWNSVARAGTRLFGTSYSVT